MSASKEAVEIPVEVRATPLEVLGGVSGHECTTWASQCGKVRVFISFGLNCHSTEEQMSCEGKESQSWPTENPKYLHATARRNEAPPPQFV